MLRIKEKHRKRLASMKEREYVFCQTADALKQQGGKCYAAVTAPVHRTTVLYKKS